MVDARVFVGKLDRTNEFQLLTPTDEMKTRCARRLEGDNAWDLQVLNLCVGSACDRSFWISTDVLQDAQALLELSSTWRSAEQ